MIAVNSVSIFGVYGHAASILVDGCHSGVQANPRTDLVSQVRTQCPGSFDDVTMQSHSGECESRDAALSGEKVGELK
ncbi:hypothetical protein A5743_00320 [Mycolicibacterium conceptionense]|nr:hypothetical protein A5743_00320 [Mycolicibacterium conceptionense]